MQGQFQRQPEGNHLLETQPRQQHAKFQPLQTDPGDFETDLHMVEHMVGRLLFVSPSYVRNGFVVKVYSILTVQLAITFAIALFIRTMVTPEQLQRYYVLFQLSNVVTLGTTIGVICCCQQCARTFPTNYLFLLVITVGWSITTGFVTVMYTSASLLVLVGVTSLIFLSFTAFACITKSDFTGMGPYLFGALMALIIFGLFMFASEMFFGLHSPLAQKIYAGVGVLLFTLFIVFDTQMIVGGRHKRHQFEVDDYVFAALNLYLDILNIFLFILDLFGSRN